MRLDVPIFRRWWTEPIFGIGQSLYRQGGTALRTVGLRNDAQGGAIPADVAERTARCMRNGQKILLATVATSIMLLAPSVANGAETVRPEVDAVTSQTVQENETPLSGWGVPQADGSILPLVENPALPESPSGEGEVAPQLIGPIEYYNCWTLGWEGLNFGNHYYAWDGEMVEVSLLCGTSGYGYRHISNNHKTDWENVMAAANDNSGNSWDDLMSFAIDASMLDPDWKGIVGPGAANKMCAVSSVYWYPNGYDQPATYSKRVLTTWSYNNKTVITSYPINNSHNGCDISKL